MKIIIFNAAPDSGKDIAVDYIRSQYPASFPFSFKTRLVELTQALYGVSKWEWFDWYTREEKELPRPELGGLSCRQALIFVSETVVKPNFGKDYFGKIEAQRIASVLEKDYNVAISSDGGFDEEIKPLVERFGKSNVNLVYIQRPGRDFSNDSRGWINPAVVGRNFLIQNIYGLPEFYEKLDTVFKTIMID